MEIYDTSQNLYVLKLLYVIFLHFGIFLVLLNKILIELSDTYRTPDTMLRLSISLPFKSYYTFFQKALQHSLSYYSSCK